MKKMTRIKSSRRKRIVLSGQSLASFSNLTPDEPLPLLVQPNIEGLNLVDWVGEHREKLRSRLHDVGALLFRGFSSVDIAAFEKTVAALCGPPLDYVERSSPRHSVQGKVYTSTDYPANEPIFLHNEQSYNIRWCGKICFYCALPAASGGQTPIADTRKILDRIQPEIRERFRRLGYIYRRNYGEGFGLTWPEVFQTTDRAEVERYCRKNIIQFEWHSGDRLTTWQRRPVIRFHPVSGEEVWFNHATFFHVSTLPQAISENLIAEFEERDLPNQTFYGDGSTIEPSVLDHLRQAYQAEKKIFDWQQGDVLVLDNMLTAHGREPFSGERRVLASMAELTENPGEEMVEPSQSD
jgi:alpha-ketoglutarate-dependent taurine dioxygenase